MIYAGIGSRNTPPLVLEQMYLIGLQLAQSGWTLRSGHAEGADMAFEKGCIEGNGAMEIYIPWFGFNKAPKMHPYIRPKATQDLADYAAQFHPAWNRCSDEAKLLHMRNVYQVLGEQNSSMVICWTEDGKRGGGTGQALRIAEALEIPVFDLAIPGTDTDLCNHVLSVERVKQ